MQLLTKAVGAKEGRGKLLVSQAHPTVSSLSEEWVEEVGASSSFSSVRWDRGEIVEVTTLDILIEEFGIPSFCKLDVEGFEYEASISLCKQSCAVNCEFRTCFAENIGDGKINWMAKYAGTARR